MSLSKSGLRKELVSSVALVLLFVAAAELPASCEQFTYNGRTVSKEYFDAINQARDVVPLLKAGEYAKAEPVMRKVCEIVTDDPDIMLNYALTLVKVGKPKEAIPYYQKIVVLNPKDENSWVGMASAYGALGQLQESLDATNEFLKRFPDSPNYKTMKNQSNTVARELQRQAKNAQPGVGNDSYINAVRTSDGDTHKWNEMPLTVYIESGADVPHWTPECNQIMKGAFDEWAAVSNGAVSFKFVDNPKAARILCNWTADMHKLRNPAEQGDTHIVWREQGFLLKAEITMLTRNPVNPQQALDNTKIKQTALHEVGHALGIGGHSTEPKDVMYFANTSMSSPELSARDQKTIQLLYAGNTSAEKQESATPAVQQEEKAGATDKQSMN